MKKFEHLEHTADIALKVYGRTPVELIRNAVEGLASVITDPDEVQLTTVIRMDISADSLEDILVRVLNELVYLFDTRQFICVRLDIDSFNGRHLTGQAHGEEYDDRKHPIIQVVKAATHHNLQVTTSAEGLETVLILDI